MEDGVAALHGVCFGYLDGGAALCAGLWKVEQRLCGVAFGCFGSGVVDQVGGSVEGMDGAVEVCELDLYESPVSGVIAEANGVIAQGRCSLPGGSH